MSQKNTPPHLYAVASDIHGNYPALLAVEEDARHQAAMGGFPPPVFICLGDTVDYGPQPNECMAWLARIQPKIVLQGNHDAEAIRPKASRPYRVKDEWWPIIIWTRVVLESRYRDALREYPTFQNGSNSLGDFAFFHGDPWGGDIYLDSTAQVKPYLDRPTHYRFAAFGHSHYQMLFVSDGGVRPIYAQPEGLPESQSFKCVNCWHVARDGVFLFNPGSVGQPRFHDAQPYCRPVEGSLDWIGGEPDRRAAYMLLHKDDRDDLHYQWRRVEYRREETLGHLRALTWPKDIVKDYCSPQTAWPNEDKGVEFDQLSDAEMAQIMGELPAVIEKLTRGL